MHLASTIVTLGGKGAPQSGPHTDMVAIFHTSRVNLHRKDHRSITVKFTSRVHGPTITDYSCICKETDRWMGIMFFITSPKMSDGRSLNRVTECQSSVPTRLPYPPRMCQAMGSPQISQGTSLSIPSRDSFGNDSSATASRPKCHPADSYRRGNTLVGQSESKRANPESLHETTDPTENPHD